LKNLERAFVAGLSLLALGGCVAKRLGLPLPKAGGAAIPAAATEAVPTPTPFFPQNRPLNDRAPVRLRADHLVYDSKKKETQFSGDVVARQDSTVLKADRMRSSNQGESAEAEGHLHLTDSQRKVELRANQGDYTDSLATARLRGGVILHSQDPYAVPVTVTGQTAEYQSVSRKALVKGDVKIWRGDLYALSEAALLDGEAAILSLDGNVDLRLGLRNRIRSQRATLSSKNRDMAFEGGVEASIIPAEIRQASAHPEH
jgi:lipopolysaccharide transport protein LptA